MAKRSTSERELIDTGKNKMFAKREAKGQFKEMDDVGRSLAVDRRRTAKTTVKSGHGDQGDRRRATKKATKKNSYTAHTGKDWQECRPRLLSAKPLRGQRVIVRSAFRA